MFITCISAARCRVMGSYLARARTTRQLGPYYAMSNDGSSIKKKMISLMENKLYSVDSINPIGTGIFFGSVMNRGGANLAPPAISALGHLRNWC